MAGAKDWKLIDYVVPEDFTMVTHKSVDFQGSGPGRSLRTMFPWQRHIPAVDWSATALRQDD
ncbi:hypothetical protein THICB2_40005 [Thiomonas sp. CB2]|nr:hypothetical protein THICB2_40005 [Thiomonas sp. CB2]CQR41328.1 hypothetical protein THICB3100015 [Thiomonas sp. CB3]VDY06159.1 protein of unknown function [Thiomonas sp. Bio17B3]VDY10542.1 protein of unknown function [Thiomonas sp. Sup16B3]VDY14423.1 conserved protein of unknown function [Thiomonas sp. OC7]